MEEREYFLDIAEQIDRGEYFEEAKYWYFTKYVSPVIERSFLIFLIGVSFFVIIYSALVMLSFRPLSKEIPVIITISDSAGDFTKLLPLGKEDVKIQPDPDALIMEYMLKKYVQAWETYNAANNYEIIERNKKIIEKYSTQDLTQTYDKAVSIRNPSSFILKFRNHTVRSVEVDPNTIAIKKVDTPRKRLTKEGKPLLSYTATLRFKALEQSAEAVKTSHWNAIIDYLYSPVTYNRDKEDFDQTEFLVTRYQLTEKK